MSIIICITWWRLYENSIVFLKDVETVEGGIWDNYCPLLDSLRSTIIFATLPGMYAVMELMNIHSNRNGGVIGLVAKIVGTTIFWFLLIRKWKLPILGSGVLAILGLLCVMSLLECIFDFLRAMRFDPPVVTQNSEEEKFDIVRIAFDHLILVA
jgi:hypothetical protein